MASRRSVGAPRRAEAADVGQLTGSSTGAGSTKASSGISSRSTANCSSRASRQSPPRRPLPPNPRTRRLGRLHLERLDSPDLEGLRLRRVDTSAAGNSAGISRPRPRETSASNPRTRPARPPPPRTLQTRPRLGRLRLERLDNPDEGLASARRTRRRRTPAEGSQQPDLGDLRLRTLEQDRLGRLRLERLDSPDLGTPRRTLEPTARPPPPRAPRRPTSRTSTSGTPDGTGSAASAWSASGQPRPRDLRLRTLQAGSLGRLRLERLDNPTSETSASNPRTRPARPPPSCLGSPTSRPPPPNPDGTGSAASAWSASPAPASEASASEPRTRPAGLTRAAQQPPPRRPPPPGRPSAAGAQPEDLNGPTSETSASNPRTRPARPLRLGLRGRRPGPAAPRGRLDRRALHLAQPCSRVGRLLDDASLGGVNSTTLSGVMAAAASGRRGQAARVPSPARPVRWTPCQTRRVQPSARQAPQLGLADPPCATGLAESLPVWRCRISAWSNSPCGTDPYRRRSPRQRQLAVSSVDRPADASPLCDDAREAPSRDADRSTRTGRAARSRAGSRRTPRIGSRNEPRSEERADQMSGLWGLSCPFYRQSLERAME